MKKKAVALSIVLMMVFLLLSACGQEKTQGEGDTVKLGISHFVEHPSLDAARDGFIQALADNGYVEGENLKIDIKIAQADASTNATIAQDLATGDYDLILAVATPSAQAVVSKVRDEGKDTPIFFTAITDPIDAGLIDSFEKPGANVTGTSDTHPNAISNTMKAIKEMFPDAKKVGMIYNAGEDNSVANVASAKEAMEPLGLEAVEMTAVDANGVNTAAQALIGACDVIYSPKDNLVVSNLEAVGIVAQENGIPLLVGEGDSVARDGGGYLGYGFKYADLGYQTGEMAIKVLKGEKPSDIPAERPSTLGLYVNYANAKAQGINNLEELVQNLPEELKQNLVELNK
jgi:putative ABC transport system substrate-binding protein